MVKQYELTVLLPAESTPDMVKNFTTTIEKMVQAKEGKVVSQENWGKKVLAYRINKQPEALYLYFVLSLDTAVVQKFEHDVRLLDNVMRSLLVITQ